MVQEIGETTDELMKADDKEVQEILNRRPNGHYWIVIHHRETKMKMTTGEMVIMRLVKAYDTKPINLLGTVILEVKEGDIISHDINLPDKPVDWGKVEQNAGLIIEPYTQRRPDIGHNYLYNL